MLVQPGSSFLRAASRDPCRVKRAPRLWCRRAVTSIPAFMGRSLGRRPTLAALLGGVLGRWEEPICCLWRVALNFESHPEASYDLVGLHVDQIDAVKIIELVSRNVEHASQRYIPDVGA